MILILVEDYPSEENKYAMSYVHTRNLYYKNKGLDFIVLNFKSKQSYQYEGISVISVGDFQKNYSGLNIELLISHAPNLKNHVRFILKRVREIKHIVMVFHGHEVLRVSKYYPSPYNLKTMNRIKRFWRDIYDLVKLTSLNLLIKNLLTKKKLSMIFVSEWMREHFCLNLGIRKELVIQNSHVINNSVHPSFLNNKYEVSSPKVGDFITIRPLDNPKYGIDIIRKLAISHPNLTFYVYGKGEYFNHYSKPSNLILKHDFVKQSEIPMLLNQFKAALMPTRLDSQGVMMCEMASFGIPVITSDIPICKEMLSTFNNVYYLNNEDTNIDLNIFANLSLKTLNSMKFVDENTVQKEYELVKSLVNR